MKLILTAIIVVLNASGNYLNAAETSDLVVASESTTANNQEEMPVKESSKKQVIKEAVLGMNVSGNKELPNVLYIVPWKSNPKINVDGKPIQNIMLDEIFAPIDPLAFSKKIKFYQQITASDVKNK